MKRSRSSGGVSYILTKKGIKRASADVEFMFIAYNLRRIGNILTGEKLKEYLRILVSLFLSKMRLSRLRKQLFKDNLFPVISLGYKISAFADNSFNHVKICRFKEVFRQTAVRRHCCHN